MTTHTSGAVLVCTAILTLMTTACGGEVSTPQACTGPEQCPADARCAGGSCVQNLAPIAAFELPAGPVEVFALVTLHGGRSADPDVPHDAVVSYHWSVASLDAPCDPPMVAGTGPNAVVRFGCPGRYRAQLAVRDTLGVESVPVGRDIDVVPSARPPVVSAGLDLAVPHSCAGAPLRCTAGDGAIQLGAAGGSATPGIELRWTVQPPAGLPLDESRRVVFTPSASVPSPVVRIETDGAAISGDWIFRLEAHDGAGILGADSVRVSVANQAPVVMARLPVFEHQYDAAAQHFTASGDIPVTIVDPDGDPIVSREVRGRHVGDGGAPFAVTDLGDRVRVAILVPYTRPEDSLLLIGGVGLERAVDVRVRDVNDGETAETLPIVVNNRPPHLVSGDGRVRFEVGHRYDPATRAYLASAATLVWTDPDGDPMEQGTSTRNWACPTFTMVDDTAVVQCSAPFVSFGSLARFVGDQTVALAPRDPWETAPAAATATIAIGNAAPQFRPPPTSLVSSCSVGPRCFLVERATVHAATTVVVDPFVDPDGDPVQVSVSARTPGYGVFPASAICPGHGPCPFSVTAPTIVSCEIEYAALSAVASDGAASATGTPTFRRTCG